MPKNGHPIDCRAHHGAGLWRGAAHHEACGIGFVASLHHERSHAIVSAGLETLENLVHRGATGADPDSGDVAEALVQMPDELLRATCGLTLPPRGAYAVGTLFTADDDALDDAVRVIVHASCEETLRHVTQQRFPTATLSATFARADGPLGLEAGLERLCEAASQHVALGATVLIVSDRDVDGDRVPIPTLLAVATVHHHLVRERTRTGVGLVAETGEAREVAHAAQLITFGAEAINPYVAIDSIDELDRRGLLGTRSRREGREAYVAALCAGLLKTIAKMGISALESYCGAQSFEALGLADEVLDRYFPETASRIGGIGLEAIAREAIARHDAAFRDDGDLEVPASDGEDTWREDGPRHLWKPDAITLLRQSVQHGDEASFRAFVELADTESAQRGALRGALALRPRGGSIALDEVEPVEAVLRRFSTGGVSPGALRPEAHETLAIAMNRLGARSNSGKG